MIAPASRPSYALLIATVSFGMVLAPLNSTMLAVALPDIREAFALSHAAIGWLVSAYLIAMAVAQPIGGRLSDQLGRNTVFRGALALFLGFSVAAALSPNYALLIVFRTGQALVGAAIIPTGMAMVREAVPVRRLGSANGITGSVLSLSAATGPLLGAGLVELGDWRLLFLVNIPIIAIALVAHARLGLVSEGTRAPLILDWPGAALLTATLVATTLVLNSLRGDDLLGLIGGAVGLAVALPLFILRQRRTPVPVAAWPLFRLRGYAAATVYIMLSNLVMYTTLLTIPFFIRELQEKGAGTTGLLLGAMSILMAVLAPVSGRLSDAQGRKLPAVLGGGMAVIAIVLLIAGISRDVSEVYLAFALMLAGTGMGLSFGAAGTAAIESAPTSMAGSAAGTNSMMRYFGSIVGAGILAGILNDDAGPPSVAVFRAIFIVVGVIAVIAFLAATQIHRFPGGEEPEPASPRGVGLPRPASHS